MAWYSVKEAAPLIGVNKDTVYDLIASRRLGHRRVGRQRGRGKIQICDQNIEDFLKSCEIPAAMGYSPKPKRAYPKTFAPGTRRPDGKPMEFF